MLLALAAGYVIGIVCAWRRRQAVPLAARALFYFLGLGIYAWATLGFLGVYSPQQRWLWVIKIAIILFLVPWLIGAGRPAALLEAALNECGRVRVRAFFQSRFMRIVGSAVFEPLFSFAFLLLLITPLAGPMRTQEAWQDVVAVGLLVVGVLTVVPLAEDTRPHTSMRIGIEFMLAFAALALDAIPGLCMRLIDTLLDGVHTISGVMLPWFKPAMSDQMMAGDILWCLAESADLPILLILFLRWHRIDDREAKEVDELSDEKLDELMQAHLQGRSRLG